MRDLFSQRMYVCTWAYASVTLRNVICLGTFMYIYFSHDPKRQHCLTMNFLDVGAPSRVWKSRVPNKADGWQLTAWLSASCIALTITRTVYPRI